MHSIGKNFDTTLKYINDPTVSEYYVPPVASGMTCDQMNANYSKLNSQIADFTNTLIASGSSAEQNNLSQIIAIKQQIANDYQAAIASHCGVTTAPGGNGSQIPSPPITTAQAGNNGLWIALIVLGGLILITHKHKP